MKKTGRMGMLLALAALLVAMTAGTAMASHYNYKQCGSKPCYGSNGADYILERRGDGVSDVIYARAGNDVVDANNYDGDRDVAYGGYGDDVILLNDGDTRDEARGGRGYDRCVVDARSEAVSGCDRVIVD